MSRERIGTCYRHFKMCLLTMWYRGDFWTIPRAYGSTLHSVIKSREPPSDQIPGQMVGERGVVANSPRLCQHQLPTDLKNGFYLYKVWEKHLCGQITVCTRTVSIHSGHRYNTTIRPPRHLHGRGRFAWISLSQCRADRQGISLDWGHFLRSIERHWLLFSSEILP